jgi:hypothetical protein
MNDRDFRLVHRDIPIWLFLLGLVFAAFGGVVLYQGGSPVVAIFLLIGLSILLFTNVVTITADRLTRTLVLDYRSALRHSRKEFSFDEITGVSVQFVESTRGRSTYRVVLQRRDGQLIPLRSTSSSGSRGKERLAAKLRDFMGVPAFDSSPTGMAHAALSSYIGKLQETEGVRWEIQPIGSARWHSPDFMTPGFFLCLAQKAEGQSSGGLLASLGSMIFKKLLSRQFQPDETPGLDQAVTLAPLDPALEPHFMAFTNAPDAARRILNSRVATLLSDWAGRYPVKQFQQMTSFGQLTVLFGPGGVYVAPGELLQPNQVNELSALGIQLVKSQSGSNTFSASAFN